MTVTEFVADRSDRHRCVSGVVAEPGGIPSVAADLFTIVRRSNVGGGGT